MGAATVGAQLARASSTGWDGDAAEALDVGARPGCSSGGYHLASDASHHPGPCDVSLMPLPSYLGCYGRGPGEGNARRPPRPPLGRPHYFGTEPQLVESVADHEGSGWATKNAHITSLALMAELCGPSARVSDRGREGPPGHSWPSPTMEYSWTSDPAEHGA